MAKDPSVLWYASDYLTGTSHFSFEEKGFFTDLLCHQQQKGHLSRDTIMRLSRGCFDKLWPIVSEKFKQDNNGLFFNERMDLEIDRRKNFRAAQSERGKKGGRPKSENKAGGYAGENPGESHGLAPEKPEKTLLENENEIENENIIENKKNDGGVGEGKFLILEMLLIWKKAKPEYPEDKSIDLPALQSLANFICNQEKMVYDPLNTSTAHQISTIWGGLAEYIAGHNFFRDYSLYQVNKHIQNICQKLRNGTDTKKGSRSGAKFSSEQLNSAFTKFYSRSG
jgi:uncharacterized protein YdaU (DUF1376 family)